MKILFIGLDYHNYTKAIIDEFQLLGAQVDWFDIQPRSFFFKVFNTVSKGLYSKYLNFYHNNKLRKSSKYTYDKVFFLQVHQMSIANLLELKEIHNNSEFILYNWDAITNHDYRQHARYFDKVYTFDYQDANKYGYIYLPLFCQRQIQNLSSVNIKPRSIYVVGNIVNPDRYLAIKSFRKYCKENSIYITEHLKISPVVFVRLLGMWVIPFNVKFFSIKQSKFLEIIESSSAVFDYLNHSQSGQTMRMMENICINKKVITNNKWVVNEKFYSKDRIFVFNNKNFTGVLDFLDTKIMNSDVEFNQYFIQNFAKLLLGLK